MNNNDNDKITKQEALNRYLTNRRKTDEKNAKFHSILQVIVANFCASMFIYGFFTSEFDISLIIIMIITSIFAILLDWVFFTTYIKK